MARVLYCRCAFAEVVPSEVKETVLLHLTQGAAEYEAVADLCEFASRRQSEMAGLVGDGPLRIVACYPRAVKWLFESAGVHLNPATTEVLNMRAMSSSDICRRLDTPEVQGNLPTKPDRASTPSWSTLSPNHMSNHSIPSPAVVVYEGCGSRPLEAGFRFELVRGLLDSGHRVCCTRQPLTEAQLRPLGLVLARWHEVLAMPAGVIGLDLGERTVPEALAGVRMWMQARAEVGPGAVWKPWFPVIDYDLCTNCMQCLSFCLFGVYGVDSERRIRTENPESCKTNCPACSRVCPEAAIVFPKYKSGPINGDEFRPEDSRREKVKIDISSLLGGDVYSALRERSARTQSRFSKERNADRALEERQKCLGALAQLGDIPAEVLMSLPSMEEIQKRAQEAHARVQVLKSGAPE